MLGVFSAVKELVPFGSISVGSVKTEGATSRLHFKVTCGLILVCSLLVTCLEWIGNGNNISCVMEGPVDKWVVPQNVINTYCYVLTTFTVPKHWNAKMGEAAAHSGVGHYNPRKDDISYKAYYQWVPFVLFLQALLFYAPHCLHQIWEGGKVKNILSGLHHLILDKSQRTEKERVLAEYFVFSLNTHNFWALRLLFVEFLNLLNAIGNIFFIDLFLGGEFRTYGMSVLKFMQADPEDRIDPMSVVFPRVTKCTFYKFGPSGSLQTHDAICVLPVNIINEKIYVFLWFWLILLSIWTTVGLLYHIVLLASPGCAKFLLKSRAMKQRGLRLDDVGQVCQVGDWKLLFILAQNMEPLVFGEFMRELNIKLKESIKSGTSTPLVTDQ